MELTLLNPHNPQQSFPASHLAMTEPNGLLAVGGCLSPDRLLNAYKAGIFPWFNPDEPILWWTPDPRLVVAPSKVHISRSLKKTLQKNTFSVTYDLCFKDVMLACAHPRAYSHETWISKRVLNAYETLHRMGVAHSIEAWYENRLVGGLYGVAIGQVFYGESMFHTQTDASKVAFATLAQWLQAWDYQLIDCQVHTPHLASMGASEITREQFTALLQQLTCGEPHPNAWKSMP